MTLFVKIFLLESGLSVTSQSMSRTQRMLVFQKYSDVVVSTTQKCEPKQSFAFIRLFLSRKLVMLLGRYCYDTPKCAFISFLRNDNELRPFVRSIVVERDNISILMSFWMSQRYTEIV